MLSGSGRCRGIGLVGEGMDAVRSAVNVCVADGMCMCVARGVAMLLVVVVGLGGVVEKRYGVLVWGVGW